MPFTLAEYKASSEKAINQQVVDEFRKSNWLLENITFDDGAHPNAGGAAWVYQYDRVTTLPTAATRAVNAEYTPQEAKTTPQTVECKIFGGAFQVDRTQVRTARYGDRIAFQLGQKIQATRAYFNDLFINGDTGASALEFDGLDAALTGTTTEVGEDGDNTPTVDLSTSANLDSNYKAFLDELFDFLALLDGSPTALLMNRTMHSRLRSIALRAGFHTQSEDAFGRMVNMFDGIPFIDLGDKPGTSNPIVPIEARDLDGDGGTTAAVTGLTDIYAVRLGLDGVHAIAPEGDSAFLNTYLPDLSEPGAVKKGEVEMVSALALKATRAAGVLRHIKVS